MKRKLLIWAAVCGLSLLVACGGEANGVVQPEDVDVESEVTELADATPARESISEGCDASLLPAAIQNLDQLRSYQSVVEIRQISTIGDETVETTGMRMVSQVELANQRIQAFEAIMQLGDDLNNGFHLVLLDESMFLQDLAVGGWQVLQSGSGQAMLEGMTDSQFLDEDLVATVAGFDCRAERVVENDLTFTVQTFEEVDLVGLSGGEDAAMFDLGAAIAPAETEIWLFDVDGLTIPTRMIITADVTEAGESGQLIMTQAISAINEPVSIEQPADLDQAVGLEFFIQVPLPPDAEVTVNSESLLGFATVASPGDVLTGYITFFEEQGWQQVNRYTTDAEGVTLEIIEFSRDGQDVAVAVTVDQRVTVVSLLGGDSPGP